MKTKEKDFQKSKWGIGMDEKFVKYFVDRTDKRFDDLEKKIDNLVKFKWQIIGGSGLASVLLAGLIHLIKITH